jgi:PAS domain S-box-containing protein
MNPSSIDANESVTHRSSGPLRSIDFRHYALSVLSVSVALGTSLLLGHFHFRVPSALLLLFAVAISSWYGGRGPAVLAVILSTIGFYWYFVEPVRTIYIYWSEIPYFIIFAAFSALLSWFGTVRRRGEADLREQAALLNLTHDTVLVMDMEGVIKYWNRGAEMRYGWTADQAVGRVVHDLLKTVFPAPLDEIKAKVTRTGRWEGELLHTKKDGSQLVAASRWSLERGKRGEPVAILETNNDITERKRAEETLCRLNRELRAISDCNQTLLRATDEQTLLDKICRIVCEEAGYRMAWVGYAEHDEAKSVRPVAWTGAEEGYLANLGITWADTERGRGPTGTAIRSGKSCCIQDFAADPLPAPWRESALQRDLRSGIALPLQDEHAHAFGSLTIYSAQPNTFTPEEIRLLEELAADLAFGIVTLRSRATRKQAEQALRQSEAYLAEAQRLSHTGSWALDASTREYSYWSDEMFRIFGADPHGGIPIREAMGRRIHPEDASRATAGFEKSLREKVDTSNEYRFVLPDGTIKHIQSIRHPVLNDAGDVVQLVGTFLDITERKAAEEALREGERRFRTFVDHAGDALFVQDLEEGTIVDVNRQACESLGYTRQELIGNTAVAFHLDSDRAEMESVAERAAAGETVVDTHCHRRKDGSVFPVEANTSYFWYGGRRFLLHVSRDITDRVQAEEQRDKLRQLEADLAHIDRVSILGELTASIAHEVNQPLSGIVSNGSACLRWLARDVPNLEEAREAVRRIVRDGKRAGEIIARIRALTKKAVASGEKLNLNETIQEVLALVGDEAKRNTVVIRTRFGDDVFPVHGDQVQLQQVVLNLAMNAIEAMSKVGDRARELVITTRNIDPDQVQVTVEDSGIGIDPQVIDRIFDSFYTTKAGGMGMGLSISRSILQAHGGRLWATAKDGAGTVFHFTLPKYHEEESNPGVAAV